MNKKLGILLFAIGLGTAASAFAVDRGDWECQYICRVDYQGCVDGGGDMDYCNAWLSNCLQMRCGIQPD